MKHKINAKRVQVTFTERQWALIEKLQGEMGMTDADIIRNIVLAWLAEKSFISYSIKKEKMNTENTGE
ncbi:MAG: hypothetical protein QXV37_01370 [Candidatus Jordarchaeaceae archaeon]